MFKWSFLCFLAEYANGSLPGQTNNYHPDFLPAAQVSSVDNPEYHLTGGETNTITSAIPSTDVNSEAVEPQSPAPTTTGRSLEDESDHEYYNDFDRLQRELQPLRRNETTVWQQNPSLGGENHSVLVDGNLFVGV